MAFQIKRIQMHNLTWTHNSRGYRRLNTKNSASCLLDLSLRVSPLPHLYTFKWKTVWHQPHHRCFCFLTVVLGKWLNLPEAQFPPLWNGHINVSLSRWLKEIAQAVCPAHVHFQAAARRAWPKTFTVCTLLFPLLKSSPRHWLVSSACPLLAASMRSPRSLPYSFSQTERSHFCIVVESMVPATLLAL